MKIQLFSFALTLLAANVYAQPGCTDPQATNYNASATVNDGSCVYKPSTEIVTKIGSLLPTVNESSGIVLSDGYVWTHNDNGGHSEIYKIDTATGALVQTVSVTNYPNNDWEDITADNDYIYVGDFGNNKGDRTNLKILKISKTQFISNTSAQVSVTAEAINFSYADQTVFTPSSTHNFDCESVLSMGDSLYIFTKDRGDMQTRVYKLPKTAGTYSVSPYTSYDVKGLITGADYNPQTKEVVLVGYLSSHKSSFLYYLDDFTGDMFFSGNKRRVEIGNAVNDWQTEGICYDKNTELFISCESSYVGATLYSSSKLTIFPQDVQQIEEQITTVKVYPNPVHDSFTISGNDIIETVELTNMNGEVVFRKTVHRKTCNINSADVGAIQGYYIVRVTTAKGTTSHKVLLGTANDK